MPNDSKIVIYGSLAGDLKKINPMQLLFKNIKIESLVLGTL